MSFKFLPKILMSKECIHFWATLYIYDYIMYSVYNKQYVRLNVGKGQKISRNSVLQEGIKRDTILFQKLNNKFR